MLLQKLKQGDYIIVNNYKSILLFLILGKVLKSLVAEKIVYLVKKYSLLLKTYFGAKKQRLIIYTLLYLCKDVFRA